MANTTFINESLPLANCFQEWQNLSNTEYINHSFVGKKHLPPILWEALFKILAYFIIISAALIGNSLVICIVWKNRRMHTTTNFYLVNLAVADVMVTISCSWVHLSRDFMDGWQLGSFFCKFNSFAQVLTLVASILTLTLISCDRFFGVVFSMKAHFTERRARTCLTMIWISSFFIASPVFIYRTQFERIWLDYREIWCDDDWPAIPNVDPISHCLISFGFPLKTIYWTFLSAILFFLPVAVMTIAYTIVMFKLWATRQPGENIEAGRLYHHKIKKKIIIMLIVLVTIFVVCWLPLQIVILYAEHRTSRNKLPEWFNTLQYIAIFLADSNSAVNPIIYAALNHNFKRGLLILLGVHQTFPKHKSHSWKQESEGSRKNNLLLERNTTLTNHIQTVV